MWNSIERLGSLITLANWGIAATLLIAFACTVIAIKASGRKDELTGAEDLRKAEHIAELDHANLTLRGQVATLETNAANASKDLAGLQKTALDAKAAQQRVETELAIQKERTANAEKAASDAALALAKFKQPRTLSPEQQDALLTASKPFAGQHFACAVFPDSEPLALLRVLDVVLKSAGWERVPSQIERQGGVLTEVAGESAATIFDSGVDAYIAPEDMESVPAQQAFCSALLAAGIHCESHRTPQLAGKSPRAITISVGKKP
jgi:hypothetical protein